MENYQLEYKSEIPKKQNQLKAEIISFLNSQGGTILIGVDDNGNKIENCEKNYKIWEEIISNWIFSAFYPSAVDLIEIKIDDYFRINIKKGIHKPYYYKDGEGFNSKGVYLRIGSSKRLASFEEIKRMMISNKSQLFETLPCDNQNLTFEYMKKKLNDSNMDFDLHGLLLLTKNGEYNNAALLLSDQNTTISKFAVFQGNDVSVFLDKKEFSGSIMKQLDDILYFSNLSNKKKIIITGEPQRQEYYDIPKRALREAICNCYCHRDWTMSGDIKIEFYDNRVLIFSPGSLPDGLTLEDIKCGMTAKRNQILVNALDKADFIENYASGVRRIFKDYEGYKNQPEYSVSDNGVIVTLYNRNYVDTNVEDNVYENVGNIVGKKMSAQDRRKCILDLMIDNSKITISQLSDYLNVSAKTIERDIVYLKDKNIIYRQGNLNNGMWIVINTEF